MPMKIIITVSNDIVTDQRIRRMSMALREEGYYVCIVGRQLGSELPLSDADEYRRFRMIFRKGVLFYMFLNIRLFLYLLRNKADAIIPVDLDTLLPAVLIRKIKGGRIIYDAHEYFTGVPELRDRNFVRLIWKRIERFSFRYIESMITVNDSIAKIFFDEYNIMPCVVRNIVENNDKTTIQRSELGISESDLFLVMQGSINMDRGLMEAIKAIAIINSESRLRGQTLVKLLIIGSGYELTLLKKYVEDNGLNEDIRFLNRMKWTTMMSYTRSADAGLSIDGSNCINYNYSLPNKIFEYIKSHIAIIATSLPEIEKIIAKHNCGVLINDNSVSSVYKAINKLNQDRVLLKDLKQNSKKAAAEYTWETESRKLTDYINQRLLS